jgi:predicted dithiol-disulfide oxidoreductase (DUF899 family)
MMIGAHKAVPNNEWLAARKELLVKEKEFSRLRDELSQLRRNLPWENVEKEYVFEGPSGKETLSDLFECRSQLIIYHFMFTLNGTRAVCHARSSQTTLIRRSFT